MPISKSVSKEHIEATFASLIKRKRNFALLSLGITSKPEIVFRSQVQHAATHCSKRAALAQDMSVHR